MPFYGLQIVSSWLQMCQFAKWVQIYFTACYFLWVYFSICYTYPYNHEGSNSSVQTITRPFFNPSPITSPESDPSHPNQANPSLSLSNLTNPTTNHHRPIQTCPNEPNPTDLPHQTEPSTTNQTRVTPPITLQLKLTHLKPSQPHLA